MDTRQLGDNRPRADIEEDARRSQRLAVDADGLRAFETGMVVISESKPSLKPENKRQRGGNEKKIVEVLVEKRPRANGSISQRLTA